MNYNHNITYYKTKCYKISQLINRLKQCHNDTSILGLTLNPIMEKNYDDDMKINIKKWQSESKLKIINILNLLYDTYSRIIQYIEIGKPYQSYNKLQSILSETKQLLIDTLIKTHNESMDDGTLLLLNLPKPPTSKLPDILIKNRSNKIKNISQNKMAISVEKDQ